MAVKMNDFLLEFYKRLIFRDMPVEQFSKFCDQVKTNDFNGHMKKWATELLEPDTAHPGHPLIDAVTGQYVRKDLPNPNIVGGEWELTDAEWTKLFNAFQTAFRNMAANSSEFKDNRDATGFLNNYFGIDNTVVPPVKRLFNYATANNAAENKIQGQLKTFLTNYQSALEFHFKDWGITDDNTSYGDILSGITGHKYNSDPKFQKKIREIARYIEYYSSDPTFMRSLRLRPGDSIPDLTDVKNGFENTSVSAYDLNAFKLNYDDLLRKVHTVPNINKVFKDYDEGKITGQLDKARDFLNYNDPNSDDFIRPKRNDELTLSQRLSDWWGKTYSDCFEKYIKFTGDRLYFSNEAKLIVGALNKEKIKPTDGLSAVTKVGKKIQDNLKANGNFTASKHMKWFIETISDFENDKNMKHIFAGALQNASQMKALIRELIIKAIRDGKKAEAKTAMEVLSVIKYGYTTSKTMDALKKEKVTIFSDSKLSWNKNEGVKFVSNALDHTIGFAMKTIGYGITIGTNAIRLSNSKIHKTTGDINAERIRKRNELNRAKTALNNQIINEENARDDVQTHIDTMNRRGLTPSNLQSNIATRQTAVATLRTEIASLSQTIEAWVATNPTDPNADSANTFLEELAYGLSPTPLATGIAAIDTPASEIVTKLRQIKKHSTRIQAHQVSLDDFNNATNTVASYNAQITKHRDEVAHWDDNHVDEFEELLNYWNMLESGRDSHTGKMYSWIGRKSDRQKHFTRNVAPNTIARALSNSIAYG